MRRFISLLIFLMLIVPLRARTYLVAVGIGDYSAYPSKLENLKLTTKDARTIVDLYSSNTAVDYALLIDSKATKARILKAMSKVYTQAGIEDIIVFFFSGHGYPGGFCAYDGKIGYDEIRRAMAMSRSKNKMMFIDACRSGGIRIEDKTAQNAVSSAKKANVMLFLSSRNNENSLEWKGMQNGFFTSYLQKGLKGNADSNKDRIITAKELFDFVHNGVSQISHGLQHPVMWGNFDDNMTIMKW